jgi:hypothetical protein
MVAVGDVEVVMVMVDQAQMMLLMGVGEGDVPAGHANFELAGLAGVQPDGAGSAEQAAMGDGYAK